MQNDDPHNVMPLKRAGDSADRVFDAIGEDILAGRLVEGQKLSEPDLARRFGTSRGPIREAIRRLSERRLVTHQPNLGVRVASFSPRQIINLYYVREALEGMAARLAAEQITEGELDEIEQVLTFQQRAWDEREPGEMRYRDANITFHDIVCNASRNNALITELQDGWHQLSRLWRRQHAGHPMRGQSAIDDHRRVQYALQQRDPQLAEILMRRHIAATRRSYEAILSASDGTDTENSGLDD